MPDPEESVHGDCNGWPWISAILKCLGVSAGFDDRHPAVTFEGRRVPHFFQKEYVSDIFLTNQFEKPMNF